MFVKKCKGKTSRNYFSNYIFTSLIIVFSCQLSIAQELQQVYYNVFSEQINVLNGVPKLNPYDNTLWLAGEDHVIHININTGAYTYKSADLDFGAGNAQFYSFAFTPDEQFFSHRYSGLYRINLNYSTTFLFPLNNILPLTSYGDTIFVFHTDDVYRRYYDDGIEYGPELKTFKRIEGKNDFKYHAFSGLVRIIQEEPGFEYYTQLNDPEYICGLFTDLKFTRLTDTFYVSCINGISKAYDYDFFDTITPNNTINMPAAYVREMDFDLEDNLWAVFNDETGNAFAIAKLQGNEWVSRIDASNSNVNWESFSGIEIDTLGNLWIMDWYSLHVLHGDNAPEWLGITEQIKKESLFTIYPNPSADGKLQIQNLTNSFSQTEMHVADVQGREVMKIILTQSLQQIELPSGVYTITFVENKGVVQREKIIVK